MKRKRVVALLAVVGLAAVAAAAVFSVHAWQGRSSAVYDPAGTWMGVNNYGGTFIISVTPWGPDRKRVTAVAEGIFDTSRGGTFPPPEFGGPAVAATLQRGWGVRTGRNTYELVLVAYAVNEDFQVVYVLVGRFTVVLTGPDIAETTGTGGYFAPDQNPFGDEAPAFGCIPVTAAYERVPMASPCELQFLRLTEGGFLGTFEGRYMEKVDGGYLQGQAVVHGKGDPAGLMVKTTYSVHWHDVVRPYEMVVLDPYGE